MEILEYSLESILATRKEIREGTNKTHNLNSGGLRLLWEAEKNERNLNLSLMMSVDGVSLDGNDK